MRFLAIVGQVWITVFCLWMYLWFMHCNQSTLAIVYRYLTLIFITCWMYWLYLLIFKCVYTEMKLLASVKVYELNGFTDPWSLLFKHRPGVPCWVQPPDGELDPKSLKTTATTTTATLRSGRGCCSQSSPLCFLLLCSHWDSVKAPMDNSTI